MGKLCVVSNCGNKYSHGVSFHKFPRDPKIRQQWTNFVKTNRENWTGPTISSHICSEHFEYIFFDRSMMTKRLLGITSVAKLSNDAVPTIYHEIAEENTAEPQDRTTSFVEHRKHDSKDVMTLHMCTMCHEIFKNYSELEIHNKTHMNKKQTDDVPQHDQREIHNNMCMTIEQTDDVPQHDQREIHNNMCMRIEQTDDVPQHDQQETHNENHMKIEQNYDDPQHVQQEIHNENHMNIEQTYDDPQHVQQEIHNKTCLNIEQTSNVHQYDQQETHCFVLEQTDDVPQHDQQEIYNTTHVKIEPSYDIKKEQTHELIQYNQQEIRYKSHIKKESHEHNNNNNQQEISACSSVPTTIDINLDINDDILSSGDWGTTTPSAKPSCGLKNSFKVLHVIEESASASLAHQCRICEKRFQQYYDLDKHCQIHFKGTVVGLSMSRVSDQSTGKIGSTEYQLSSSDSTNTLMGNSEYDNFGSTCSTPMYQNDICNEVSIPTVDPLLPWDTDHRPFICDMCGKACSNLKILQRHKQTHTVGTTYKCDVCNKAFSQKRYFRQHIIRYTDKTIYKCEICNSAYHTKDEFRRHTESHSGEKPF